MIIANMYGIVGRNQIKKVNWYADMYECPFAKINQLSGGASTNRLNNFSLFDELKVLTK